MRTHAPLPALISFLSRTEFTVLSCQRNPSPGKVSCHGSGLLGKTRDFVSFNWGQAEVGLVDFGIEMLGDSE